MSSKAKVLVVLIHYNTPQYLKTCMFSLAQQKYENLEIVFIDNASPGKEGLGYMHEHHDDNSRVTIIANAENRGYARAANQGIRIGIDRDAKYIAIANPDIIFDLDYFSTVVKKMESTPHLASITGKMMKYDFQNNKETDLIDSVGLLAFKNRRIIDFGQGEVDEGQYNKEEEIFGVSGAAPLYRTQALIDTAVMDEYFDEDFFMYKEDVDLAWRMLVYGWNHLYTPDALAYHGRGTGVIKRQSPLEILKNRKALSRFQKENSFRNQLLMQFKNDQWGTVLRHLLHILPVKLLTPFYILFKEPYLAKSYLQYLRLLPRAWQKRRTIMQNRKRTGKEMAKYFN
ncbi:glycosyltransferase [Patescibacteria group bacterium]|nr:glycosyltransferase [Patescibacteria group bacterium]